MDNFFRNHFPGLLDKIYAAGLDPELWPQFLDGLARVYGDAPCQLYVAHPQSNLPPFAISHNIEEASLRQYAEHYGALNPYPRRAIEKYQPGDSVCAIDCLTEEEGKKDEFYNGFMKPNGWSLHHLGTLLFKETDRVGIVTVAPQTRDPAARLDDDLARLRALTPHVTRALEMNRQLKPQDATGCSAGSGTGADADFFMEQLESCAFLIGENGSLIHENAKARHLMQTRWLFQLDASRQLHCSDRGSNARLVRAFRETSDTAGCSSSSPFLLVATRTAERYVGWIVRHRPSHAADISLRHRLIASLTQSPCRLLLVKPLSARFDLPAELIREILGLSPTESKIVSALASGLSLKDYASNAGVKQDTAKKQLASVFAKLDINSQSALLALIANLRDLPR